MIVKPSFLHAKTLLELYFKNAKYIISNIIYLDIMQMYPEKNISAFSSSEAIYNWRINYGNKTPSVYHR